MANQATKLVDIVDQLLANIARWAVNHRLLVVLFSLTLLGGGLFFAGKVQTDNSLDAYFDKADPAYIAYEEYLDQFHSDEVSYLLYRVPDRPHGPFNYEAMQQIASLTAALENEVPFLREVTSLTNVEFIRADGDSITIDELMIDFPDNQSTLLELRESVLDKPIYVNYLINQDASYGAIILEMSRSSVDTLDDIILDPEQGPTLENLYPQASDSKIREILSRPEYAGLEFYITGDVAMNAAYNYIFTEDTAIGTLLTLAMLAVMSALLFRVSWLGLLGPLAVVLLSTILVLAVMGIFGWVIGLFFGIVPTLLCAVGVAQSVHIILEFQRELAVTGDRKKSVEKAIGKVGGACLLAALTTAFGFLVMSVSHLKVLSEMAMYAAAGVMFTLIFSISLLVVFLAGGKKSASKKPAALGVNRWVLAAVQWCIRQNLSRPKTLLGMGGAVIVVSVAGLSLLRTDFNFLTEFKPHVEWRQHTEKAESVMGGILNFAYLIDTGKADGVKDPELLHALDRLQQYAESLPRVKKTYSVVDIQKDLNRSFHGDDKSWYRVPDDRALIGQYFLVYEISGGKELEDFVSRDYATAVLELRIEIMESSEVRKIMNAIDQYLEENPLPGADVRKTGIGLMWIKIADYIADTQLYGYSLIFVGIALFLCIAFGSIKVGLLTMIPNILPVVAVMGLMGWLDMHLDYMKLLLATIAIGIAVDDSIHLVTRFRHRFKETGNYAKAMEQALEDVGPALIITTLILLGAFACYQFSNMAVIADFGLLLSVSIASALIADLLFMPALLMLTKPFGKEHPAASDSD
ncbi:MMPL family transporter [Spongiibacter taiwanensis]|uniref:efflux RND transporter permease subunit n=1 Tax=Spongiibacter taiwanensis TaxID=1748242 RepID=UPI002035390F|nr:MMPL family transporter [Spongiibacter taiwanensis]USA43735.1 MMPL family transporter [Spongiibacter taiwanensis]